MNTTLRSAKYRARKIIRAKEGRQRLLYGERRFARDELERQEKDPTRKMAFEKARKAAHARKRHQKFGRGGLEAFQRKFFADFGVEPTTEETEVAKWEGYAALVTQMQKEVAKQTGVDNDDGGSEDENFASDGDHTMCMRETFEM